MLFGKRKRIVKRILVVEDEPLTAFDTEVMLAGLGCEVVATLDSYDDAMRCIEREQIDLIVSDVRLHGRDLGIDLAKAAKMRGIPTLLATGHEPPDASCQAVGCLRKPYSERQFKRALDNVEKHLAGKSPKPSAGLQMFVTDPA